MKIKIIKKILKEKRQKKAEIKNKKNKRNKDIEGKAKWADQTGPYRAGCARRPVRVHELPEGSLEFGNVPNQLSPLE
jgi:hypothetical protein